MKCKKILSTALIAVLLFTCIISAMPIRASAAYSEHTSSATASADAKAAVELIKDNYSYATAQDMLDAETALGYIDTYRMSTEDGDAYELHINRYTGMMYYVNGITGQILTSNPFDTSSVMVNDVSEYMMKLKSQVLVEYNLNSTLTAIPTMMTSYMMSAKKYQLSVTPIVGGFRVNYTLGNTTSRFLFPSSITYRDFREQIFGPIYDRIMEILDTHLGGDRTAYDFFQMESVKGKAPMLGDCLDKNAFQSYIITAGTSGILNQQLNLIKDSAPEAYAEAKALQGALLDIFNAYNFENPYEWHADSKKLQLDDLYERIPLTQGKDPNDKSDDLTVLVRKDVESPDRLPTSKIRAYSQYIREYCPDYTFADMDEDEEECGQKAEVVDQPIFRCALEYRLDTDGTLLVELPANSITFDASKYTLTSISVLPFFGAGDARDEDGYAFYPDGSGTIIEFEDMYTSHQKVNIQKQTSIFGDDYCYSYLTGSRKLQVTMPVYGVVGETAANAATIAMSEEDAIVEGSTVTNGFFAILEEGAALANLHVNLDGTQSPYMNMYSSYTPYAVDKFDLSMTIESATSNLYCIVSETPYAGSYTQRFVMLRDEAIQPTKDIYVASYLGMAFYYRDYLERGGVLTALDEAQLTEQMPLYLETIGAMEIDDTFLTFPIKRDIPLTSFEDIITMYETLKDEGIKNINVRMTAYANGGMYATYPVKLRWERAVGGKNGFRDLVSYAAGLSKADGEVLGLYPEFDFMYINYTSLFDGIRNKGNVSRKLDNRYASRSELDVSTNTWVEGFSSVIAGEALDGLYAKFLKKYQKYDATGLSVSTMGSDLSSNFDEDGVVDRDTQQKNVMAVLEKMSENYSLMMDKGNAYTLAYADHLLNASIDSSHFRDSSYAIPFLGIVLHGYVNYAGSPLNNSGSPEYDILRSIENGASLYYVLCYQNIEHMKKYEATSIYYSVDFQNWLDDVVANYHKLNNAIGDVQMQTAHITDHKLLIGERVINATERQTIYRELTDEYVALAESQLKTAIDAAIAELQMSGNEDRALAVDVVDIATEGASLFTQYLAELHLEQTDAEYAALFTYAKEALAALAQTYESAYPAADGAAVLTFDSIEYETQYRYLTTSSSTDDDEYVSTIYTNDNGNIVLVTYTKEDGEQETFILNYNIFAVTVKYEGHTYTLDKYEFINTKDKEG